MNQQNERESSRTEADNKLIALRESGYTGPIDKNGDKAEDHPAAHILNHLRDHT